MSSDPVEPQSSSVVQCLGRAGDGRGDGLNSPTPTGAGSGRPVPPSVEGDSEDLTQGQITGADAVVEVRPARRCAAWDGLGPSWWQVERMEQLQTYFRQEVGEFSSRRGVLVTLTIDRKQGWLHGPESAYAVGNERVRKALSSLGVEWMAAFEVQTKTGDGWPHWHAFVLLPADDVRAADELKADLAAAWDLGFVDVQVSASVEASATYVTKYLSKTWDALPPWMLGSRRVFRKLRISSGLYDGMERRGIRPRQRGERREKSDKPRHRLRRLSVRIALSGMTSNVYQVNPETGELRWAWSTRLPLGVKSIMVPERVVRTWAGQFRGRLREELRRRVGELRDAWSMMQMQRMRC